MKKVNKALIIVTAVFSTILIFFLVINMVPKSKIVEGVNPFKKEDTTLISAHRGGASINPENTEKAFDYSIVETNYSDIIELDIHMTSDGEYVINHDDSINRTGVLESDTNAEEILIANHTYLELRQYNLGVNFKNREGEYPYRNYTIDEAKENGLLIMRFEDFLDKYKEARDFKLFVEIKATGAQAKVDADYLNDLLHQEQYSWYLNRTMIISFDDDVIDYIASEYEDLWVSPLGYDIIPYIATAAFGVSTFYLPPYDGIQLQYSYSGLNLARRDLIEIADQRNIATIYWTINDIDKMKNLLALGADVITTNSPDYLYEVITGEL